MVDIFISYARTRPQSIRSHTGSDIRIEYSIRLSDLHAADLRSWQPENRGVEFQELPSSIDRLVPRRAPQDASF